MNEFMKAAKDLADTNLIDNDGGPFGAVVVKDGQIVGKGDNRVLIKHDATAHAEITAIRDACQNLQTHELSGCVLYTNCYPCPICLSAIIWANIKKVYYGCTKEDAESIGFRDKLIYDFIKDPSLDIIDLEAMDRDETIKSFNEYKNKIDKTIY